MDDTSISPSAPALVKASHRITSDIKTSPMGRSETLKPTVSFSGSCVCLFACLFVYSLVFVVCVVVEMSSRHSHIVCNMCGTAGIYVHVRIW